MKRTIFATILFSCSAVQALEPAAVTNAANDLLANALGAEHACFEFVTGAVEHNEWTPEESAEILLLAERSMHGSTNSFDVYRRNNAISMLGAVGGTNALPALVSIFQNKNESDWTKLLAGNSFLQIVALRSDVAHENILQPLKDEIRASPASGTSFACTLYRWTGNNLEYAGPSESYRRNLLRFLLDQISAERGEAAMLDEILCREIPKWRASLQRAENAAKMIREYPDDGRLVAFFESVRTNALASARTILLPNHAGADAPASTNQNTRVSVPSTDSDPWADLLADLPEKEPWTPPPDYEPPF